MPAQKKDLKNFHGVLQKLTIDTYTLDSEPLLSFEAYKPDIKPFAEKLVGKNVEILAQPGMNKQHYYIKYVKEDTPSQKTITPKTFNSTLEDAGESFTTKEKEAIEKKSIQWNQAEGKKGPYEWIYKDTALQNDDTKKMYDIVSTSKFQYFEDDLYKAWIMNYGKQEEKLCRRFKGKKEQEEPSVQEKEIDEDLDDSLFKDETVEVKGDDKDKIVIEVKKEEPKDTGYSDYNNIANKLPSETPEPTTTLDDSFNLPYSKDIVGRLYPVLIDPDGNVIDGKHRLSIDKNWPKQIVEGVDSPKKKLMVRIHANLHRRDVHPNERTKEFTELAEILESEGFEAGKITNELSSLLGFSYRTISEYLPDKYKSKSMQEVRKGKAENIQISRGNDFHEESPPETSDTHIEDEFKVSTEPWEDIGEVKCPCEITWVIQHQHNPDGECRCKFSKVIGEAERDE